jgi:alkylated DNA repair dioxygenase AlkB
VNQTTNETTTLQPTLFGTGPPRLNPDVPVERKPLDDGAWVDLASAWLSGADELCEFLIATVPWRHGRRWMYDRMVDEPRLTYRYETATDPPHPVITATRQRLSARYARPFGSVGLNLYRGGADSVAFHRDRELRHLDDTIVAILTLGARRPFRLRPLGGGRSHLLMPASGDLLVMGGACQLRWEHSVPKTQCAQPRISLSWRGSSHQGG